MSKIERLIPPPLRRPAKPGEVSPNGVVPVILMTSDVGESDFSSSEVGAPDATLCKPLSFHHLELGLQMVTDFG